MFVLQHVRTNYIPSVAFPTRARAEDYLAERGYTGLYAILEFELVS